MRRTVVALLAAALLSLSSLAYAVPVLQVGAPAGPGEGIYANYQGTPIPPPTETDTAITSGDTLYVAGVYQNNNVQNLGGHITIGDDWSHFADVPTAFNGHGAILMASVADGTLGAGTITVNGLNPIFTSTTQSFFPNEHDPVKSATSDFLFFDIGDFSKSVAVPDFVTETAGSQLGEIKTLTLAISGYTWVHFDVMALETDKNGRTNISTNLDGNPGSHDVTYKGKDPVPEPGTMMLLGAGFLGLAIYGKRRKNA